MSINDIVNFGKKLFIGGIIVASIPTNSIANKIEFIIDNNIVRTYDDGKLICSENVSYNAKGSFIIEENNGQLLSISYNNQTKKFTPKTTIDNPYYSCAMDLYKRVNECKIKPVLVSTD